MSELYMMNEFCIVPDMDRILHSLACTPQSHSFRKVVNLIQSSAPKLLSMIEPAAWYCFTKTDGDTGLIVCLLTLGNGIDAYMSDLLKEKKTFPYLMGDAILQEYMFQVDEAMMQEIETVCKSSRTGIVRRLNPPEDYPWRGQRWIADTIQSCVSAETGISLTENYIFKPNYTMGYILLTGDEKEGFHGRHDCSRCTSQSCSRRQSFI